MQGVGKPYQKETDLLSSMMYGWQSNLRVGICSIPKLRK